MNEMKRTPDWEYTFILKKQVEEDLSDCIARQKQPEINEEISKMVRKIQMGIK